MVLAVINLIIGMVAGLIRIGWGIPINEIAIHHGALMVGGFLGTLILLEKVIPLKNKVFLILPLLNALGLLMIIPGLFNLGLLFLMAGSISLLSVFVYYILQQPHEISNKIMATGALCQIIGHLMLFSKHFYPAAFPWWMGFILFVIVGERVELSKFLPVTQMAKKLLVVLFIIFLLGLTLPFHGIGKFLSGLSLVGISLWLLRHDVISIGLKKKGMTHFSAFALLAGCVALMLTGIFLISLPDIPFAYDAIIHTFFIGFAFSMIFAHGPIILPGVLGLIVKPYHPILYIPLCASLISLVVRLVADINLLPNIFRLWSGWGSVISILFYFIVLAIITFAKVAHAKAT